jgi:hypothetical protein
MYGQAFSTSPVAGGWPGASGATVAGDLGVNVGGTFVVSVTVL